MARTLEVYRLAEGLVRLSKFSFPFKLNETTRAYLVEKLSESSEFHTVAQRHARRYVELFKDAEAETETRPTDEWLAIYGPRIDNVRAALDWALSGPMLRASGVDAPLLGS